MKPEQNTDWRKIALALARAIIRNDSNIFNCSMSERSIKLAYKIVKRQRDDT